MCRLSTARNGHRVRLCNFANKLKITICVLSIACSNNPKKKHKTAKMILQENYRKSSILKDFSTFLAIFIREIKFTVFKSIGGSHSHGL